MKAVDKLLCTTSKGPKICFHIVWKLLQMSPFNLGIFYQFLSNSKVILLVTLFLPHFWFNCKPSSLRSHYWDFFCDVLNTVALRLNLLAPSLEILFVNFHNGCCWSLSFCHYWSSVRRCCRRRKSRIFYHLVIFLCHHHFTLYAPGICFAETASNPCLPPSSSHSFPNFKTYSFDKEERAKLRDPTLFSWCKAQCLKVTEKVSFFICWAKRAMFIF